MHLFKPPKYTTPRVSPKVNYRHWVITFCQHRFTNCNKCSTLKGDVDNSRGYPCISTGGVGKSLYLPLGFATNDSKQIKS